MRLPLGCSGRGARSPSVKASSPAAHRVGDRQMGRALEQVRGSPLLQILAGHASEGLMRDLHTLILRQVP